MKNKEKKTVLCVDDNENHLETIVNMVKNEGHTTLKASNYSEALIILNKEQNINVLLTDYNMEPLNGIKLCEYTAINFPQIKKIIISSMENIPRLKLEQLHHIDTIIMKVNELQNRINEFL